MDLRLQILKQLNIMKSLHISLSSPHVSVLKIAALQVSLNHDLLDKNSAEMLRTIAEQ